MIKKIEHPRNYFWSYGIRDPFLGLIHAYNVSYNRAYFGLRISNTGGAAILESGIFIDYDLPCDADSYLYKVSSSLRTIGVEDSMSHSLHPDTHYYIRGFVRRTDGYYYTYSNGFTTPSAVELPTVTTGTNNNVYETYAEINAEVTDEGDSPVIERGVCFNNTGEPDLGDNSVSNGSGLGIYTTIISGLIPDTTYFVRAYATSASGTSYGSIREIKTQAVLLQPEYVSSSISSGTSAGLCPVNVPYCEPGDILIILVAGQASITYTTPSGWNLLGSKQNSNLSYAWYWKRATGTESNFLITENGLNYWKYISGTFRFRNVGDTWTPTQHLFSNILNGMGQSIIASTGNAGQTFGKFYIVANGVAAALENGNVTQSVNIVDPDDWTIMLIIHKFYTSGSMPSDGEVWIGSEYFLSTEIFFDQ